MKINFIYQPFPKGYCWSTQSGMSKKRLIKNIIKEKQVYVTAELKTKTSIYTTISLHDDSFGIGLIPLGCEHLKFLSKLHPSFDGYESVQCFKIFKKQGKKEYEFYLLQLLKELIPNIEEQINELNILITTNVKKLLYDTIQINEVTVDSIIFTDGSKLTYGHKQDCCENNYADFKQIDDLALSYSFKTPLKFELCDEGFRFGDGQKWVFVPCYSEQNGYYSNQIDIIYNNELVFNIDCIII